MTEDVHALGRGIELALELADLGAELYATKLKREHPEWSAQQIERAVVDWFQTRPGAEHGDAEGQPIPWPRENA